MKLVVLSLFLLIALALPANAANRFWVGGSGNWSDNVNHWSASTGGAPNASTPTSADSVFFDSLSNATAYTVTIDTTANCLDMTWALPATSGAPSLVGTGALSIFGSLTLVTGMTITNTGPAYQMMATATGKTITTAGVTLGNITFSGVGGGWTLQDTFNVASNRTTIIGAGTFNSNAQTINTGVFTSTSGTRTLTLTNSTINLTSAAASTHWNLSTAGTLTFNGSGLVINQTGATGANNWTFAGAGKSYSSLNWLNTSATGTLIITGANTLATLQVVPGAAKTIQFPASTTQTISTLLLSGGTNYLTVNSSASGTAATLSVANAGFVGHNLSVKDITISGAGTPFYAAQSVNVSGNTGWTFGLPAGTPTSTIPLRGVGGWLLKRDLDPANDNSPMWLEKAA